jgi:hypothetical protein
VIDLNFFQKFDGPPEYEILNLPPGEEYFQGVGLWSQQDGLEIDGVIWHDGTTNVPDLDVRNPIKYWSCYDKESHIDRTAYEFYFIFNFSEIKIKIGFWKPFLGELNWKDLMEIMQIILILIITVMNLLIVKICLTSILIVLLRLFLL